MSEEEQAALKIQSIHRGKTARVEEKAAQLNAFFEISVERKTAWERHSRASWQLRWQG